MAPPHKRRRVIVEELENAPQHSLSRDRHHHVIITSSSSRHHHHQYAPQHSLSRDRVDGNDRPGGTAESSRCSASSNGAVQLVDWTFRDVDSYAIARAGRAKLEAALDTKLSSLTYGEISVGPFVQLLSTLPQPETPPHFIDIGSGTGKAVLAAALAHSLASAVGIELVPQLHDTAVHAKAALGQLMDAGLPDNAELTALDPGEFGAARERWNALGSTGVELYCGDSFKGNAGMEEPEWVRRLCPLPPEQPAGLAWVYAPCACFDSQMVWQFVAHDDPTRGVYNLALLRCADFVSRRASDGSTARILREARSR